MKMDTENTRRHAPNITSHLAEALRCRVGIQLLDAPTCEASVCPNCLEFRTFFFEALGKANDVDGTSGLSELDPTLCEGWENNRQVQNLA